MRNKFQEHFPLESHEITDLWKKALIIIDANTLLNFYRYSDTSRREFLDVLRQFGERIRIPEQAAHEFFKNRLSEIAAQEREYDNTIKQINKLKDTLYKDRGHPFISDDTMEKLEKSLKIVDEELCENRNRQGNRINSDDIMRDLSSVLDGKVTSTFTNDEFEDIFKEGEDRYSKNTPPGYMDKNKNKDNDSFDMKRSLYGDLLIWKQTIKLSISEKKSVIFVTDDRKEDWWLEVQGRTVGPRAELKKEFILATGKNFHMYKPEQFLRYAKEHLNSEVSPTTLEEIAQSTRQRQWRDESEDYFDNADINMGYTKENSSMQNYKYLRSRAEDVALRQNTKNADKFHRHQNWMVSRKIHKLKSEIDELTNDKFIVDNLLTDIRFGDVQGLHNMDRSSMEVEISHLEERSANLGEKIANREMRLAEFIHMLSDGE